jgi:hypothetical protein
VQAATGFPLLIPAGGAPPTPQPSEAVLKQLRAIDEGGLLLLPES